MQLQNVPNLLRVTRHRYTVNPKQAANTSHPEASPRIAFVQEAPLITAIQGLPASPRRSDQEIRLILSDQGITVIQHQGRIQVGVITRHRSGQEATTHTRHRSGAAVLAALRAAATQPPHVQAAAVDQHLHQEAVQVEENNPNI